MSVELAVLDYHSNFLGFEPQFATLENSSFVVVPVPLEKSTTYGKGTAHGPGKIIEASRMIEFYDEKFDDEPCRRGIATLIPIPVKKKDVHKVIGQCAAIVCTLLEMGKFPILLGGEHTITIGGVQGVLNAGKNFSVVHLDAHSDLRDEYENSKYNHACAMHRIWEMQPSVVLCGIRSQCAEEKEFIKTNRIPVYYAHDLKGRNSWEFIINHLEQNVYLTIDCDFFDPSVVPAVGTPEPGGFFWEETLQFLQLLVSKRNIVGFDVVELSPQAGLFYSEFTVAKLIYKLIGYIGRAQTERFQVLNF